MTDTLGALHALLCAVPVAVAIIAAAFVTALSDEGEPRETTPPPVAPGVEAWERYCRERAKVTGEL